MIARLINSEATLNNFKEIGSIDYVPGEDRRVAFRLFNEQLNIRYIPGATATVDITIYKSDNTALNVAATALSSDDRSMWYIDLSEADTTEISGSNMEITVVDGTDTKKAVIFNALSKNIISGDC